MEKFKPLLAQNCILPVICLKNEEETYTLMNALLETPLRCVEITLRHPFAPTAISLIKKNFPQFVVGAGTLNSLEKLEVAINCGADFGVSPGLDEEVVSAAKEKGFPFLPGISTPSEILKATKLGLTFLKFFPAQCCGGAAALNLLSGVFPEVAFIPTGGISSDNFVDYLQCKNVVACGGSFMIPKAHLESKNVVGIRDHVTDCMNRYKEVSL